MGRKAKIKSARRAEKARAHDPRGREMIRFNIDIPYLVKKHYRAMEKTFWVTNRQISEQMHREVLVRKYPQGSKERSVQEIHADLDEAFTLALNEERNVIEVERLALKHLLEAAETAEVPVEFSAHVRRLRDAIKKALDEDEAAAKAAKNGTAETIPETAKA